MSNKTVAWRWDLTALQRAREAGTREGQTVRGESILVRYVNFVKLPHTVFALPFAFLGVVYASFQYPVGVRQLVLVLVAFTAVRFAAMGFNRIVDWETDALNPRTRGRELPTGALSMRQAAVSVALASVVFVVAAGLLNRVCLILSVPALLSVLGYSYSKRFTSWSHLWLGGALAVAPIGGYLAVAGRWSTPAWPLLAVAAGVTLWVAGFDIFYALQDEHFDREQGLRSAVVLLGRQRSILLAKSLHGITLAILVIFGVGAGFGVWYYLGIAVGGGILTWEHRLVKHDDLSRVGAAFFTFNGIMSLAVLAGALLDRVL